MHSANRVPLAPCGILLFLGWLLAGAGASAQPPAEPAPAPKAVTAPATGEAPRQVLMPVQAQDRITMSTGKAIREVINQREVIVKANVMPTDQRVVLLQSDRTPGNSVLRLTDVDGNTEEVIVVVQLRPAQIFDIDLMRRLIKQAVPTANIFPILGGGNSVILTGTVAYAEDIPVILQIAENIVRAGPPDPITQASLQGGAGGSGVQPDAFNTATGVRAITQLSIVNAIRIGGSQQVQLDVVVARVSRSELRQMGFSSLYSDKVTFFGNTVGGTIPLGNNIIGRGSSIVSNNGVLASPSALNTDLFLGVLNPSSAFFGFLQALREENLAKLLAEPKLVTLSGRPAQFVSGGDQAVPEVSALGSTGVRFIPFGTTVRFLPIVLGNGKIYMEVEPEVSELSDAAGTPLPNTIGVVPGRTLQRIRTSVLMEDGQTFAIGGLIQHDVQGSTSKLPLLGDLPFIGVAFSQKNFQDIEQELVVLVTPHLVDPMDCKQVPHHLPGQETRNPDDFELFLEGILEAPRGPREVWHHHRYVAAFKNDPTLHEYPCAGNPCQRFPNPGPGLAGPGPMGSEHGGGCGCCGGAGYNEIGCGGTGACLRATVAPPAAGSMPVLTDTRGPSPMVLPAVQHTTSLDSPPSATLPAAAPEWVNGGGTN